MVEISTVTKYRLHFLSKLGIGSRLSLSLDTSQVKHQTRTYPRFFSMKIKWWHLTEVYMQVLLIPLRWMIVHCQITPSIHFASTHLYTRVERDTVRVNCNKTTVFSCGSSSGWVLFRTGQIEIQKLYHLVFRISSLLLPTLFVFSLPPILSNPGATYRDDVILSCELYFWAKVYFKSWSSWSSWSKCTRENIASSRLVAPRSLRRPPSLLWVTTQLLKLLPE